MRGSLLACGCVWYSTRLCRYVCVTRAFHNRQTAPFYAHSKLHSTTMEKHAEQRKWQHLQKSVHIVPCGPVIEIYSDTPVLIGGEIEHLLPVPQWLPCFPVTKVSVLIEWEVLHFFSIASLSSTSASQKAPCACNQSIEQLPLSCFS